jgi:hypothetical protein
MSFLRRAATMSGAPDLLRRRPIARWLARRRKRSNVLLSDRTPADGMIAAAD